MTSAAVPCPPAPSWAGLQVRVGVGLLRFDSVSLGA
jgi:hypothetical protein